MFQLLQYIYNDIISYYTVYDTISAVKEELNNINSVIKNDTQIKKYLNLLIEMDEPELFDREKMQSNIHQFKVQNSLYQLNVLRTDMINWKQKNIDVTYIDNDASDWEIVNDPMNLPCNNYILYLKENMPENITTIRSKDDWLLAKENGFSDEVKAILTGEKEKNNKEIWVDKRLLGKKWLGLFNSITPQDTPLMLEYPKQPRFEEFNN